MKRFVLGDIHGEFEYLQDVLQKSGFDYDNDLLIQIGDIVDRGDQPFKCMDELLKIRNLILIKGNHDAAFDDFMKTGQSRFATYPQNGMGITITRYKELADYQKLFYQEHIFDKQRLYHITEDNIMFVHAGFPPDEKLEDIDDHTFTWDRELVQEAMNHPNKENIKFLYDFKEVFLGHTPTIYWGKIKPQFSRGIINIDTGSGKGGPLTIMNIDTKEYWQSSYKINLKDYGFEEEDKSSEVQEISEINQKEDLTTI